MTHDRQSRFVMLVQTVLHYQIQHGRWINGQQKVSADLYETIHCLDDACYYANEQAPKLQVNNLASLAQQFVTLWHMGDPAYKRHTERRGEHGFTE
jgi:hypothetical protein